MIGQTISHYEILSKLGAGGMGVVYKARDTKLDRILALKFLPANVARDEETKQRFIQEAKAASSLDDPHICTIFEIGEADDGQLFIAMAYYDGSTLQDVIESGGISPSNAASIARQMAMGLSTAHEAGIVHRDVKPANVMVTQKGLVKLLDFGVAKLEESLDLTRDGSTIGTAAYMSPEQTRGEPVDARSDIWSIGAVLYEMLAGTRPFGGGYEAAVAYSIVNVDPPPLSELRPELPDGLSELVQKALNKQSSERYQKASDLAADLAAFSGDTVVEVSSQSSAPRADVAANGLGNLATRFSLIGAGILAVVYAAMMLLGLPNWVFPLAVFLVLVGFPITMYAASIERQRGALDTAARAKLSGFKVWLSAQSAMRGAAITAVLFVLLISAYSGLRAAGIGPFASLITSGAIDSLDLIVLTEFDNLTDTDNLGATVTEALRIDLSQSTVVTLMNPLTVQEAIDRLGIQRDTVLTAALGLQIAEREGVKATIEGEISSLGASFQIAARIVGVVDGNLLVGLRETATSEEDIVAAIDRLSARLRTDIGESLVDIRSNPPLTQATTTSITALRHLTLAEQYQNDGRSHEGRLEAEKAISADSLFGMAYRKAAIMLSNAGMVSERVDSLFQRAFDLRDRMTERERLLTEGSVYSSGALDVWADQEKARVAYERVLQKWPDDTTALNNLSIILMDAGEYEEAEALVRKSLAQGPNEFRHHSLLVTLLKVGNVEEFLVQADEYERLYPTLSKGLILRRVEAWSFDRFDEVERLQARIDSMDLAQNVEAVNDVPFSAMDYWMSRGQPSVSKRLFQDWMRSPRRDRFYDLFEWDREMQKYYEVFVQSSLARWDYRASGDPASFQLWTDSLYTLEGSEPLQTEDGFIGWSFDDQLDVFLEIDDFESADEVLGEVEILINDGLEWAEEEAAVTYQRHRAYVDAHLGRDPASAAAFFEETIPPTAVREYRDQLGKIWELAGDANKAIEAYTSFVSGIDLQEAEADQGLVAPVHFKLGEIHSKQGNIDLAITHYQKMIDRWKGADVILQPQVAEAQRRIDQLLDQKARAPQ